MLLAADTIPVLAGITAIIGAVSTFVGLWLSRKGENEANATQREAVTARVKLDEVETLRAVVETLSGEADRLNASLHDANDELENARAKIDQINRELLAAVRNVGRLRVALQVNGIPIPELEPMHDVN
jgi:predicted RNase H-like nuclease (RuvC/YqgF family)